MSTGGQEVGRVKVVHCGEEEDGEQTVSQVVVFFCDNDRRKQIMIIRNSESLLCVEDAVNPESWCVAMSEE